jgi:hypothetical protein
MVSIGIGGSVGTTCCCSITAGCMKETIFGLGGYIVLIAKNAAICIATRDSIIVRDKVKISIDV